MATPTPFAANRFNDGRTGGLHDHPRVNAVALEDLVDGPSRGGTLLAQDEGLSRQFLQGDRSAAGKRVRRPDHRHQEVGENSPCLQLGMDGVVGADSNVVPLGQRVLDDLAAVPDADLIREVGMPAVQRLQQPRQVVVADNVGGVDPQGSHGEAPQVSQRLVGFPAQPKDSTREVEQNLALLGERYPLPRAVEESHAVGPLKPFDLPGDRRLREMQLDRRRGEVSGARHLVEDVKLMQVHVALRSKFYGRYKNYEFDL